MVDRDPEPDRDGGHLPAARGAARPVHGAGVDGLPGPRAELAMLDSHSAANPLDDLEPVTDAAEIAKLVEIVRTVHVVRSGQAVRRRHHLGHPPLPRPAARRLAARDPAPRPRRPRPRGAGGRDYVIPDDMQTAGRARARPPAHHRAGSPDGWPRRRRRRRPRCCVRSRSPRAERPTSRPSRRPRCDQLSPPSRPADAHSSPRGSPQRCARSCSARRTCCGWGCC